MSRITRAIRNPLIIPLALFGLLYVLFPTKMHYIDGVYYAEHLENYPWYLNAFHPHHLLFLPFMHLLYDLSGTVVPSLRAMTFMQIFSAFCGIVTLWLFAILIRRMGFGRCSEVFGVILLGSAYTFWHHSTDANIYIFAHAVTLLAVLIVLSRRFFESVWFQILVGALIAFAGFMHQLALLALIPTVWYVIAQRQKYGYNPALRICIVVAATFIVIYPTVFVLYRGDTPGTIENFFRWIGAFAKARHYFAFTDEHGNLVNSATRGHVNAFFALKPLERILFHGRTGDTATSFKLYGYVFYLTLFSVFVHIILSMRHEMANRLKMRYILYLFLIYFIATVIFMPENHFYKIFYLPSLILIWISIISSVPLSYKIVLKPVIAFFLVWFFMFNLSKGIIPNTKIVNNPYMAMTHQLDDVLMTENDVILFPPVDRYFTGIYRYFGKGDAIHVQHGEHFIHRDKMLADKELYEQQTIEMLEDRYDRIFMTRDIFEMQLDPLIFTSNNYRLPHPRFMIVDKDRFELVTWHEVYGRYYAEVKLE